MAELPAVRLAVVPELRVVFTDQGVIIEKALFSCPATYPDSFGKLFTIAP